MHENPDIYAMIFQKLTEYGHSLAAALAAAIGASLKYASDSVAGRQRPTRTGFFLAVATAAFLAWAAWFLLHVWARIDANVSVAICGIAGHLGGVWMENLVAKAIEKRLT